MTLQTPPAHYIIDIIADYRRPCILMPIVTRQYMRNRRHMPHLLDEITHMGAEMSTTRQLKRQYAPHPYSSSWRRAPPRLETKASARMATHARVLSPHTTVFIDGYIITETASTYATEVRLPLAGAAAVTYRCIMLYWDDGI
jgi:hypothetical protein